jgi:Acyl-CoA synthetases (AMP-forming)/AMP-acid ligases II
MDSLSNGLATRLIAYGVKRGNRVGLYMEKSIEMFLSILAALKAGASYVPLDPDHPAERVQAIIDIAETSIVLTSRELQDQFVSVVLGNHVTPVVVTLREMSPASKPNVGVVTRYDISHILFTSGSTGTPKGAVSSHPNDIEG